MSQSLLSSLLDSADARRSLLLESIAEKETNKIKPGQYKGYWQGYYEDGDGRILYQGKMLKARLLGTTSIAKNTEVNLSITENGYYANW